MRPLESFSDETWDRLFDFISHGIEDMPVEEIEADLRDSGTDMSDAIERMRTLIQEKRQ